MQATVEQIRQAVKEYRLLMRKLKAEDRLEEDVPKEVAEAMLYMHQQALLLYMYDHPKED